MKNKDCAARFANTRDTFTSGHVSSEDGINFKSYRTIVATKTDLVYAGETVAWVTGVRYSNTTTRHCSDLVMALSRAGFCVVRTEDVPRTLREVKAYFALVQKESLAFEAKMAEREARRKVKTEKAVAALSSLKVEKEMRLETATGRALGAPWGGLSPFAKGSFPKMCKVCQKAISEVEWETLPFPPTTKDGRGNGMEFRNHECGSTLSVELR